MRQAVCLIEEPSELSCRAGEYQSGRAENKNIAGSSKMDLAELNVAVRRADRGDERGRRACVYA
jgi:hypothetical protein